MLCALAALPVLSLAPAGVAGAWWGTWTQGRAQWSWLVGRCCAHQDSSSPPRLVSRWCAHRTRSDRDSDAGSVLAGRSYPPEGATRVRSLAALADHAFVFFSAISARIGLKPRVFDCAWRRSTCARAAKRAQGLGGMAWGKLDPSGRGQHARPCRAPARGRSTHPGTERWCLRAWYFEVRGGTREPRWWGSGHASADVWRQRQQPRVSIGAVVPPSPRRSDALWRCAGVRFGGLRSECSGGTQSWLGFLRGQCALSVEPTTQGSHASRKTSQPRRSNGVQSQNANRSVSLNPQDLTLQQRPKQRKSTVQQHETCQFA